MKLKNDRVLFKFDHVKSREMQLLIF